MKFPPKSFEKYEKLLFFARKCYKTLLPTGGEMFVHFSKKLFQIAQKLFQVIKNCSRLLKIVPFGAPLALLSRTAD